MSHRMGLRHDAQSKAIVTSKRSDESIVVKPQVRPAVRFKGGQKSDTHWWAARSSLAENLTDMRSLADIFKSVDLICAKHAHGQNASDLGQRPFGKLFIFHVPDAAKETIKRLDSIFRRIPHSGIPATGTKKKSKRALRS